MSDDVITIVSLRVTDANPALFIQGSKKESCDRCGEAVWVAPTSQAVKRHELMCTRCALPLMMEQKKIGEELRVRRAPGAAVELQENLKRMAWEPE